ncbi:MAG: hypothetical protein ABWY92_20925 [Xanthobacteraceae bacterium]|jgi:hypothetical protein
MATIRTWVIVTAAAFLALPLANAWARDCKRHPSLCAQSAEAKTANAAAPRAAAAVQKRKARVAKRTQKLNPSRAAREPSPAREAREQAPSPEVRAPADGPAPEPPVNAPSLTTTTIDWVVMLPQPLANAAPAALAKRHDQPALAAAGGAIALPGDDTQSTGEVVSAEPPNEPDAAVRFVNPGDVNEIDLAAVAEPAPSSWLRYVLATLGALLAAASTIRALFV